MYGKDKDMVKDRRGEYERLTSFAWDGGEDRDEEIKMFFFLNYNTTSILTQTT